MQKEIKGGADLERVTAYLQVLFVCFLNTLGLFLGTVSDLAKFHSNYSGEKKQQTKNTLTWVGKKKNLRTWCWWEGRLKVYVRPTQMLLMFEQLLSYYFSCYRCSCDLCNRMFKKIKEKLQQGFEVIRVSGICICRRLEYKFLYILRINHLFVFLFFFFSKETSKICISRWLLPAHK